MMIFRSEKHPNSGICTGTAYRELGQSVRLVSYVLRLIGHNQYAQCSTFSPQNNLATDVHDGDTIYLPCSRRYFYLQTPRT
jgi:hypothetical protein